MKGGIGVSVPSRFENLTAQQKKAAALLVDNELADKEDKRKIEDIAAEVGVHRKTLWEWKRRNALFAEYKQHLTTLSLQDHHGALAQVLIDNLTKSQPSTKMLDLLAKMMPNALAAAKQEIDVSNGEGGTSEDVISRIRELEKAKEQLNDEGQ